MCFYLCKAKTHLLKMTIINIDYTYERLDPFFILEYHSCQKKVCWLGLLKHRIFKYSSKSNYLICWFCCYHVFCLGRRNKNMFFSCWPMKLHLFQDWIHNQLLIFDHPLIPANLFSQLIEVHCFHSVIFQNLLYI